MEADGLAFAIYEKNHDFWKHGNDASSNIFVLTFLQAFKKWNEVGLRHKEKTLGMKTEKIPFGWDAFQVTKRESENKGLSLMLFLDNGHH